MNDTYWTFVTDIDQYYDVECESLDDAIKLAEDWWINESYGENIFINFVLFQYNDDGEMMVLFSIPFEVGCSGERSDYDEHNTYYCGGVL